MIDMEKYLPTPEMKAEFEKFKTLKTPEEIEAFKKERKANYDLLSEQGKESYRAAAESGIEATMEACNDFIERVNEAVLRDRLGELPEAISFSYIAKKYFGKSRNWLYQRINGNTVNGKKAHFTESEHQTFINALKDVSEMINQTSLKLS